MRSAKLGMRFLRVFGCMSSPAASVMHVIAFATISQVQQISAAELEDTIVRAQNALMRPPPCDESQLVLWRLLQSLRLLDPQERIPRDAARWWRLVMTPPLGDVACLGAVRSSQQSPKARFFRAAVAFKGGRS